MKAAAKARWGKDSLAGQTVAVQGAGKVALPPVRATCTSEGAQAHRHRHRPREGAACGGRVRRHGGGARRDLRRSRPTSTLRARSAPPSTTTRSRGSRPRSWRVAPTTSSPRTAHGDELERRGILYAPDYVINGGGVINVYGEIAGLAGRALAQEGGGDLRDAAARLRDRPDEIGFPTYRGGRPAGGAAHRGVGGALRERMSDRKTRHARAVVPLPLPTDSLYIREPDARSHSHRRRSRRVRAEATTDRRAAGAGV